MPDSKVSVVLPTYNGERYLSEAVESVVNQTYPNWELIIVDDCSTDSTSDIIKRYLESDERIFSYRNDSNKKLPASLNVGFEHASGDYYTWISDDNLFREDALATMVEELDKNERVTLVYCDMQWIDESGNATGMHATNRPPAYLYFYNVVQGCFLYRSNLHRTLNGYDEQLFLIEDYDFWLRANRGHELRYVSGIAPYYYRTHGASLTSTRQKDIREKACAVLRREIKDGGLGFKKTCFARMGLMYNLVKMKQLTK